MRKGSVQRPEPRIQEHTADEFDKRGWPRLKRKKKTLNFLGFCYSEKCLKDTQAFHTYSNTKPEDFIVEWSTISHRYLVWKRRD